MTVVVATDLDGTLVYSRRTVGSEATDLRVAETRDGVPVGWVTHRTDRWLAELARRATWVPTTTRTVAQYRRLRLPATRWTVCANGGVLLDRGVPDPSWAARVAEVVAEAGPIGAVTADVARLLAGGIGPLRVADGLFLTARVDRTTLPAGWSTDLAAACAQRGWVAYAGPAKVHVLPDGLTKEAAAAELRHRLGVPSLLAAGDSALDATLLADADAAIRPAHGELHGLGWSADHVAVTSSTGARAGEEIAAWLLERVTNRVREPRDTRDVADPR